jgi:hypothetical protein
MNKKIYRFDKFFEKGLTLSDLDAPAASGKRGDTLVRKLKNKEKFRLTNGEEVDIELMKDPDIDGPWVGADVAADNMLDDSGSFDIIKATNYLKNTKKSKLARANSYVDMFVDTDTPGGTYSLSDFQKDKDFGSTGAGVRIREHESIQMLFLAKRLAQGVDFPKPGMTKKTVKDRTTKEIINGVVTYKSKEVKVYKYPEIRDVLKSFVGTASFNFGNVDLHLAPGFKMTDDIFNHYCDDQSWLSTFCNVPNQLCSQKYKSKGDNTEKFVLSPNIKYTIYHVSYKGAEAASNVIFKKYKELSKGHDVEFSKYCPADIFIVDTNSKNTLNAGINACKDIFELNVYLNDCFNDKQIIPVSLKRVGPSPNSATLIVNAEAGMKLPTFEVSSFKLSKDMNKGIGSKIMTNSKWIQNGKTIERERNLTIDSPNSGKNNNVDAEVDGVWARHGKVSFTWIKKFIEESTLYQNSIEHLDKDTYENAENAEENTDKTKETKEPKWLTNSCSGIIMEWKYLKDLKVDELTKIIEKLQESISKLKTHIKVEYNLAGRDINNERKLISKIQSLQVIKALALIDANDGSGKEVNRVVSNMLLYALSIQNPGFSSPKYIRVI